MNRQKSSSRFRFVGAAALLVLLALLVPALRDGDQRLYFLAAGVTAAMLLCMIIPARLFSLDRMILSLALYLGAVGIFSIAPADPDAALMQWLRCSVGAVTLIIGAMLIRVLTVSMLTSGITSFLGLLLLAGGLLTRDVTLPFTEAGVVLLMIAFSSLLSAHGGIAAMIPGLAGTALLLLQGQTVEAIVLALAILLLLWSSDGRIIVALAALAVFAVVFFAARQLDTSRPSRPGKRIQPLCQHSSAPVCSERKEPSRMLRSPPLPSCMGWPAVMAWFLPGLRCFCTCRSCFAVPRSQDLPGPASMRFWRWAAHCSLPSGSRPVFSLPLASCRSRSVPCRC